MAILRPPSKSVFRPAGGSDQSVLDSNQDLVDKINRRNILKGAISLGALTMLTGCDVTEEKQVQSALRAVSTWNDHAQALLFRANYLAPTYAASQVLKPPRFNAHYAVEDVKPVDASTWRLELSGKIRDKKSWSVEDIYRLPEQEMIIRHICVEGWDYVGQWSGVNTAKYVAFKCFDGYTESLDMASALHPQTLLATKYANEPLPIPFGFPLRLRTATKLGYKNAKWLTAIEVTNEFSPTYYSEQGFNWFGGI
jgi:DMSO/TMAO reductase YedYZ molybdopterin-dependent catalytic subunit